MTEIHLSLHELENAILIILLLIAAWGGLDDE